MSILIVEDNPVNALLLEKFLEKGGHHTRLAKTAKDALATLENTTDIELIITDLNMPDMDGFELIEHIRRTSRLTNLPIIVVSAQSEMDTIQRVGRLRCEEFLVKPVDKIKLLARVEALLTHESHVLQDKQSVMTRLGLVAQEYEDLIKAFGVQLSITKPLVISEQAASEEVMSENLRRLLQELAESARILGAEQFTILFSKLNSQPAILRSQCPAVLTALQELESALSVSS